MIKVKLIINGKGKWGAKMVGSFTDIRKLFNTILSRIDDVWLMADILEIPPTNNMDILFDEFQRQYGVLFIGNRPDQCQLSLELFYRVDEVQNRIGKNHEDWYKGIYVIKNISDYINILSKIQRCEGGKELWYRGQLDAKFHLTPNIFRNAKEIATDYGFKVKPRQVSWFGRGQKVAYPNARKMLDEFKDMAKDLIKFEIGNDLEWIFLAQHYGMLTPLLDWTEDPLVGLFFAMDGLEAEERYSLNEELKEFEKFSRISEAAAIYVLDPGELNKNSIFKKIDCNGNKTPIDYPIKIDDSNVELFSGYIDGKFICPLAIKAPKKEFRISRQSGNFVFQGSNIKSIDSLGICRKILYKIYVPYAFIKSIRWELGVLNITSTSIYGEESYLDKCAKNVRLNGELRFKELIEDINLKYLKDK